MMSETWEEAWEHDFPNIDRTKSQWKAYAMIYQKGYEAGQRQKVAHQGPRFDAENVPQSPARAKVRKYDPDTSWEAALSVSNEHTAKLYALIYQLLSGAPMPDDHLYHMALQRADFPITPSGVRSRRSELVRAGWVVDGGGRVPLRTGRKAIAWEAVQ